MLAASIFIYLLYLPTPLSICLSRSVYLSLSIYISIDQTIAGINKNNNFKQKQPVFSNVNIQIIPKIFQS